MNDVGVLVFQLASNYWVDVLIALVLVVFAMVGTRRQLINSVVDFVALFGGLVFAANYYWWFGRVAVGVVGLDEVWGRVVGFVLAVLVFEVVVGVLVKVLLTRVAFGGAWWRRLSILSGLFSLGRGIVLISFLSVLVIILPVTPFVKQQMGKSRLVGMFLGWTSGFEVVLDEVFGEAAEESIAYIITPVDSRYTVKLDVVVGELVLDEVSEKQIFDLVNSERGRVGVGELVWDELLAEAARSHAYDMWRRGYFSHFSPEGDEIADRLWREGIDYFIAGENLAMAPSVASAHLGLMKSEGHRENILDGRYGKLGVGVVRNGVYGRMFVQVFAD